MTEAEFIDSQRGLLKAYSHRLSRLVSYRVSPEDLVQYGCIGLLLAYRKSNSVPANTSTITWRSMIDGTRHELRRGKYSKAVEVDLDANSRSLAVSGQYSRVEARADIESLAAGISGGHRGIKVLFWLEMGFSQREIASWMGFSPCRAGQLQRAGIKALRRSAGLGMAAGA